jgi:putative serine protease PepD
VPVEICTTDGSTRLTTCSYSRCGQPGRVVGITTAIATVGGGYIGQQSGSIGVGFAIPSGAAYRIATRLLTT